MIKDPAFWRVDGLSMAEHRERVLSQMHLLVDNGGVHRAFPKEYGGEDDATGSHRPSSPASAVDAGC